MWSQLIWHGQGYGSGLNNFSCTPAGALVGPGGYNVCYDRQNQSIAIPAMQAWFEAAN